MNLRAFRSRASNTSSIAPPPTEENVTEDILQEIFLHNPFVVAAWCCTTIIITYLISKFSFLTIKSVKYVRRHSKREEIRIAARRNLEENETPLIHPNNGVCCCQWKRYVISIIHFPLICIRFAFAVNATLSWGGVLFFLNMFHLLFSVSEGRQSSTESSDNHRQSWSLFYMAVIVCYYLSIYCYYIFGKRGEMLSVLPSPRRTFGRNHMEACDKYQDFSSSLFETFMVGLSQMLLIAMYILAALGVFGAETPDWTPKKNQDEIDTATYYVLGMVVQLGYVLSNGQLEKFIQNWTFWNNAWEWRGNKIELKGEGENWEGSKIGKDNIGHPVASEKEDNDNEGRKTTDGYSQRLSETSYHDAQEESSEHLSSYVKEEESISNVVSSENMASDAVMSARKSLKSILSAAAAFRVNQKSTRSDAAGLEESSQQEWDIENDFKGPTLDFGILQGVQDTSEEGHQENQSSNLFDDALPIPNPVESDEEHMKLEDRSNGTESDISIPEPVIAQEAGMADATNSEEQHQEEERQEIGSSFLDVVIALEIDTKAMDIHRSKNTAKVISTWDFWVRFIFATVVNGIGFWIILLLLPHQLAKSSDPVDFVLNSVAAYFIIEMDDLDNGICFEKQEDSNKKEGCHQKKRSVDTITDEKEDDPYTLLSDPLQDH